MRYEQTVFNHMNQQQLAEYWGISTRTLERWRSIGWGPKFIKIGGRVLYRVEDILEYEAQHLADSTKSRVHHEPPADIQPASANKARTTPSATRAAEPAWKPITAKIQEGLLIFEIPTEFRCNAGDLEYCLADGELRLRTGRMSLGKALRVAAGK